MLVFSQQKTEIFSFEALVFLSYLKKKSKTCRQQ
jgi:hypothetical protein